MRRNRCTAALAFAAIVAALAACARADAAQPAELQAYWAVRSVTVDGKPDGGEEGSFLIVRADGTYRIAKRGRKPEGTWELDTDGRLLLKVGDRVMMRAAWRRDGDALTLSFEDRGAKVEIRYARALLDKEPKAPDEE